MPVTENDVILTSTLFIIFVTFTEGSMYQVKVRTLRIQRQKVQLHLIESIIITIQ